MSNILIIKHGSLGDIAQASGAIQDIYENHKDHNLYIMTSKPYVDLYKKSPFITDVILDKRLSRFNVIYLYLLIKNKIILMSQMSCELAQTPLLVLALGIHQRYGLVLDVKEIPVFPY